MKQLIEIDTETHAVVPREPTELMLQSARNAKRFAFGATYEDIIKAAIAAAPQLEPYELHDRPVDSGKTILEKCVKKPEPVGYVDECVMCHRDDAEYERFQSLPEGMNLFASPPPDHRDERIKELEEELQELTRRFQNEVCGRSLMGEPAIQKRDSVPTKMYESAVNGRREFRLQVIEQQERIAELTAALEVAKDALDHYLHGGSSYRKPAEEALTIIEELKL